MDFIRAQWKMNNERGVFRQLLYPSTIVEEIATKVISTWLNMEQFCKESGQQDPTSSAGNVLLTGTKGVGKTTLMMGLAAIINSFSGQVRAVYNSFENNDSLVSLSEVLGFDQDTNFTTETYDQWSIQNRKCLIYFGDEFDTLYELSDRSKSIRIARQILNLGKSTLGFGIISGSSAWLRSLAFKEDANNAKHLGFPDLNCSVFVEYRLQPVRDKVQLEGVLRLRGRDSLIEHVNEVFILTGGVGRMIDALKNIKKFKYSEVPKIEKFLNNAKYGALIRQLYVTNCDYDHNVDFYKQKGLTEAQLIHTNNYYPAVMDLIDRHILHMDDTNGTTVEFLYPYHLKRLQELFGDDVSHLESLALETTLKGWQGFGSAGQVLKPLILRTLVTQRKDPFNNASFKYDNLEWHHSRSPCELMAGGNGVDYTLDLLYDTVCIPIPDDGLDSFVLMRGQGNSVSVEVSQIKCGELGKRITSGGAKSADASKYFTAILKKANTGWDSLLKSLQKSFPDKQFNLTSFALVTNKTVADDVRALETVEFGESLVPLMVYSKDEFDEDFANVLRMFNISPQSSS